MRCLPHLCRIQGHLAQRRIQNANEFADAATSRRRGRIAPQDIDNCGRCTAHDLFDEDGAGGLVGGVDLDRSRGLSCGAQDVPDLGRSRKGMQEGRARRVAGRSSGVMRGLLVGVPSLSRRPVRVPRGITKRLRPFGPVRERPCHLERVASARVIGSHPLENHERRSCAIHGPPCHRAEFVGAEVNIVCHRRHPIEDSVRQ